MAGRQLGRYEILTQLATGGMASVYIARAQGVAGFERLVAIKVLHPHLAYEQEFISMFLDEARLAARIRHMNVVPTIDISDSLGDGYFLVMEYIEGNHLGVMLGRAAKRGERLAKPFVFRVLIDALQGLGAAHRLTDENGKPLQLVHRDVSPHNILIGTDGIARLTDFGVAKADVRMASTRAGQFKGKLSYMAPEQAATNETDQRSDLFSMGIILWESLTGRRLFKGDSNGATLNKLLNDPITKPSELWPDLEPYDAVVMKALDRDPDRRFQTADEFSVALDLVAGRAGVAKTRDVAEVVRDLDAEKLQDERQRVRDAIELLGRAEIGLSKVPMPRDSTGRVSTAEVQAAGTGSFVHGRISESGIDPVDNPAPAESHLLRWLVMLLALVVLMYAGFLTWRLASPPPAGAPTMPVQPAVQLPPAEPAAPASAEPPAGPRGEREGVPEPDRLEQSQERTSAPAPKPRRRRVRRKAIPETPRAGASEEQRTTASPEPAKPSPVDIDIDNPYRN
ncbi:MAG TPA: serine/threonine-protein kinase [Polyangiales bacterium]|nr:serine/threonine-protein kinase [Polyangiales bacterium]